MREVGASPYGEVNEFTMGSKNSFAELDVDLSWTVSLAVGDVGIEGRAHGGGTVGIKSHVSDEFMYMAAGIKAEILSQAVAGDVKAEILFHWFAGSSLERGVDELLQSIHAS